MKEETFWFEGSVFIQMGCQEDKECDEMRVKIQGKVSCLRKKKKCAFNKVNIIEANKL